VGCQNRLKESVTRIALLCWKWRYKMKIKRVSIITIVMIIALIGGNAHGESKPEPKMENLFQEGLADEFTAGREVIISLVEVPPNTTLERHWHPGEEFHYCLEGEAELVIDGQPTVLETSGKVAHVPYKKMHTLITKKKGVKLLVFRVHTKGEPVRYLEKGGTAEK
jgi:quercetin dioxygenase-like cupin family protein